MALKKQQTLFGAEKGWRASEWTASDDRIRGGKSQSYLKIDDAVATFCGNLDFDTLGGAGFASQRTTGDDRHWDLSSSHAVELLIDPAHSDDKRYTFILKDEILPRNPENGREQSTTSWEYDFQVRDGTACSEHPNLMSVVVPWDGLKPTYRGKEKDPGRPLKLPDVRRISLMMRSHFGEQQGDFSLAILSIATLQIDEDPDKSCRSSVSDSTSLNLKELAKETPPMKPGDENSSRGVWTRFFTWCNKL